MTQKKHHKWILSLVFVSISTVYGQNSLSKIKADTISKNDIGNYLKKYIVAKVYEISDESNVVYFEDSINKISCKVYIASDIELTLIKQKPKNYKALFPVLQHKDILVLINGMPIKMTLKKDGADAYRMLLPDYISNFTFNGERYLQIVTEMVSFMPGNYRYTFLLKLDSVNKVIDQYGIGSSGALSKKGVQDILSHLSHKLKMPKQYAVTHGEFGILK